MILELAEYNEDTCRFDKNVKVIEIGDKHIYPWYVPVLSICVNENRIKFNLTGEYKTQITDKGVWVMTDDKHMKTMLKKQGIETQYIPEKMR